MFLNMRWITNTKYKYGENLLVVNSFFGIFFSTTGTCINKLLELYVYIIFYGIMDTLFCRAILIVPVMKTVLGEINHKSQFSQIIDIK